MGGHCGVWTHAGWPKLSLFHLGLTMTFHQMLKSTSFHFGILNSHLLLCPIPNWPAISTSSIFKWESLKSFGWGSTSLQNYILCLIYQTGDWGLAAGSHMSHRNLHLAQTPHICHSGATSKVQQSPCCHWGFAIPAPPHQDIKLISRWQGSSEEADPFQSKLLYDSIILVFLDLMHKRLLFNVCKASPNCCFEGKGKAALEPAVYASCKHIIFKACKLASAVSRHH